MYLGVKQKRTFKSPCPIIKVRLKKEKKIKKTKNNNKKGIRKGMENKTNQECLNFSIMFFFAFILFTV